MSKIPIIGATRIDHGEPRLTPAEREAERRRQLAARNAERPEPGDPERLLSSNAED